MSRITDLDTIYVERLPNETYKAMIGGQTKITDDWESALNWALSIREELDEEATVQR